MADIPVVVLIPMKNRLDLTTTILRQIRERAGRFDDILLYDNGSDLKNRHELRRWSAERYVTLVEAPNQTITQMWNAGWDLALAKHPEGPVNLAILNNDVEIPSGFLDVLSVALRLELSDVLPWLVYPGVCRATVDQVEAYRFGHALHCEITSGTVRHGGMSGWAFMVAAEKRREGLLEPIDEQFRWWCGDDDLAFSIGAAGGAQYRVDGLPVFHHGEGTASLEDPDRLEEKKRADLRRCREKWGQ
jgi:hypothetical protein